MKWLLTIQKEVDLEELRAELERLGSTVDTESLVPLDDDAQVIEAEGPEDLPSRLVQAGMSEVKAYPNSELELFEPTDAGGTAIESEA